MPPASASCASRSSGKAAVHAASLAGAPDVKQTPQTTMTARAQYRYLYVIQLELIRSSCGSHIREHNQITASADTAVSGRSHLVKDQTRRSADSQLAYDTGAGPAHNADKE